MNRIVLADVTFDMGWLYNDSGTEAFNQLKESAVGSAAVSWARANGCEVKVMTAKEDNTMLCKLVYYAELTPKQQVEFALRF